MLGDAVDGAEAADEGGAVDPHHLAIGKEGAEEVQGGLVGRGVEDRHEDGRVGDVEVGVAGGIAVVGPVAAGRHRHFQHAERLPTGVFGLFQSLKIVLQRRVVGVLGILFDRGHDHAGGDKAGEVIDMAVGVVALQSVSQPDDLLYPEPVSQFLFDLGPFQSGVTVGIQKAVLRGEQGVEAVGVDGAALEDILVGFKRGVGHRAGGKRNAVVRIPGCVFPAPTIEAEIVGDPRGSSFAAMQHENGAAVAEPGIVGLDGDEPEIRGLDAGFPQSLADFVGCRAVVDAKIDPLAGKEGADDFQVGLADGFHQAGPGALVMGPGQPSGLVFLPLGRETVLRPVDRGGGAVQWAKKRWSRPW